jgi:chromosomal replication initiation ATPase DnaA
MRIDINLLPSISKIIQTAEKELTELIGAPVILKVENRYKPLTSDHLQQLICASFNIHWHQMIGTTKERNVVNARHIYCYISCVHLKKTTVEVGNELNRDHSTVINARENVIAWLKVGDPMITAKVRQIEDEFLNSKLEEVQDQA